MPNYDTVLKLQASIYELRAKIGLYAVHFKAEEQFESDDKRITALNLKNERVTLQDKFNRIRYYALGDLSDKRINLLLDIMIQLEELTNKKTENIAKILDKQYIDGFVLSDFMYYQKNAEKQYIRIVSIDSLGRFYNVNNDKKSVGFFYHSQPIGKACHCCGSPIIPNITAIQKDSDGYEYCEYCAKTRHLQKCDVCGKMHLTEEITINTEIKHVFRGFNINSIIHICNACRTHNIHRCNDCGEVWLPNGEAVCAKCKSGLIHDYNYKPTPKFKKTAADDRAEKILYFGLEIEIESNIGNVKKLSEIVNTKLSEYFYCKHDGSLDNGVEFVSEPMTYKFFTKKQDLFKKVMLNVVNAGGYSYGAPTTGVHIHLSRSAFLNDNHIINFMHCFYNCIPFSEFIAMRSQNRYAHYNNGTLERFKKELESPSDRYRAINLCNGNTVEVRIYKGNLKFEAVLLYVQHCLCAFNYAKKITTNNKRFNIEDFKDFILGQAKGYEMLKARVVAFESTDNGKFSPQEKKTIGRI